MAHTTHPCSGEAIRKVRAEAFLTLREFGDSLGVSTETARRLTRPGTINVSVRCLVALAKLMDTTPGDAMERLKPAGVSL